MSRMCYFTALHLSKLPKVDVTLHELVGTTLKNGDTLATLYTKLVPSNDVYHDSRGAGPDESLSFDVFKRQISQ